MSSISSACAYVFAHRKRPSLSAVKSRLSSIRTAPPAIIPAEAARSSLLTYEDARRRGPQIAQVTASRFMPSWLPEHGYGDFADERRLSSEEIALIQKWVSTGMPRGDTAEAPPIPQYDTTWTLGKPDLILTIQHPATLPASGSDIFLNFVLPYPLAQTHYIRAMEIRPGTPQVVHHANVLIDRTASWRRAHPDTWRDGVPAWNSWSTPETPSTLTATSCFGNRTRPHSWRPPACPGV